MAATIEQDRIDSELAERAKANADAFKEAAEQTAGHMATQTRDLVDGVSAGIDVILTNLEDFIERAVVINRDLAALEVLYKDMKAWTDRTKGLRDRTLSQATEALEQHTQGISAQVEDAIAKAAAKRQKLEADLGRTVHELQATRTHLRGMVQSLRDDGDRYDRYE
jgi:phage-related protein